MPGYGPGTETWCDRHAIARRDCGCPYRPRTELTRDWWPTTEPEAPAPRPVDDVPLLLEVPEPSFRTDGAMPTLSSLYSDPADARDYLLRWWASMAFRMALHDEANGPWETPR